MEKNQCPVRELDTQAGAPRPRIRRPYTLSKAHTEWRWGQGEARGQLGPRAAFLWRRGVRG